MPNTKPYSWWGPEGYPQKLFVLYDWKVRKTDKIIFWQGRSLPFDSGNPNMECTKQDPKDYDLILSTEGEEERLLKYDLLPNTMGTPIVSKRALDLLLDLCPKDIQAFPAVIEGRNAKHPFVNHDYVVLNITHTVDAIDREKSILRFYEDNIEIKRIKSLVFKENCMNSHHISRLKGYEQDILVSPTLVDLFKKHKIKGALFLTDEQSYDFSY